MSVQAGTTLTATAVLAANTPIRMPTLATFAPDPDSAAVSETQIPGGEIWDITDIYISAAGDIPAGGNANVVVDKNRGRSMYTTAPLTTLLVSNNSRNGLKFSGRVIRFLPFEYLRFKAINIAAIGAAAITDTFYVDVNKYPSGR